MSETVDRRGARLERLRALIAREGTLRLAEAARVLDVSTMTLRRDLADGGSGIDLLGGHLVDRRQGPAAAYTLEGAHPSHLAAKAEAGRRAAALIKAGDTIFVDCGTTMPHLMAAVPSDLEITIVCYALPIANQASRMARAQLFLLGGLFHSGSATFFAKDSLRGLKRLGIAKAFLSAGGIDAQQGATCSNFHEVPVKRAIMERAARSYLVVDSSKQGLVKPARFAAADAFHRIVTENG